MIVMVMRTTLGDIVTMSLEVVIALTILRDLTVKDVNHLVFMETHGILRLVN